MSYWTYITGTIIVDIYGGTNAENKYIIDTVLEHLPYVTGSEGCMKVHAVRDFGYNSSCTHNEFNEPMWLRSCDEDWLRYQSVYLLTINASLRDRMFDQTYKEFIKWLTRLSKRVSVRDVLVKVSGWNKEVVINDSEKFSDLFESYSFLRGDEPNWTQYLRWVRAPGADYPALLTYKYYKDPENDKMVERWFYDKEERT